MKRSFLLSICCTLGMVVPSYASDWPQWRGPHGSSLVEPGAYPVTFSETESLIWKADLPGVGSSTPAVWGDQIYVTAGIEGQDGVIAYNWEGKKLWQKTLGEERPGRHKNGSGSNPSPLIVDEHVIVYYKSGTLASLSAEGEIRWQINLQKQFGEDTLFWDLGTSPMLAGGNLVIAVMQEGESYVVAINPADGTTVWKVDRTFQVQKESGQSYTTPILTNIDGQETIVIWGADHLTGHDPKDGKILWTCGGFNPEDKPLWRVIASPAIADGIVVVPYGRTQYLAGVKLGGEGDITGSARIWERNDVGTDCPTPIIRDGRVYLLTDRGALHCLDLKTGQDLWTGAIPRASANYFASPILAGEMLYCAREDGVVSVVKVGDAGMEVIAQNRLEDRLVTTPVLLRDRVILRGAEHLYCFGAK